MLEAQDSSSSGSSGDGGCSLVWSQRGRPRMIPSTVILHRRHWWKNKDMAADLLPSHPQDSHHDRGMKTEIHESTLFESMHGHRS